ncbi:MAG: ATP-dependent helicase [Candidatus Diapherotrites archaeon]|nr:ATP-dependent helicase [Candidatus Diapherotrites archaeon]
MSIQFQTEKHSDKEIFANLNPWLTAWFKHKFEGFTEPQKYAILNVHRKENTLVTAPTGSGKTLSAFSGVLSELITLAEQGELKDTVYCIYISPLRALSNDIQVNLNEPLEEIEKAAGKIGKKFGIRVGVRTGDTLQSERAKQSKKPPHILVTTPESLAILLNSPKFREHFKNTQWVIIDEIHALAENKRGVHLSLSLERLQRIQPNICRIGLSATIEPLEEIAKYLAGKENEKNWRDCKIVDARFEKTLDLQVISPLPDLINVSSEQVQKALYETLHDLIQAHKTTLIFTNTRSATERVVDHLKEKYPGKYLGKIGAHHSSVSRSKRLEIEQRLKKGELKVVVCSTSLELGIDIGFIDLVILLGSPKSIARALQRVGRSGHKLHDTIKGKIIVMDRDDLIECAVLAKQAKEHKIDKIHIPTQAMDVLAQHIYGIAIGEKILVTELFELIKKSYCYEKITLHELEEILSYLSGEYTSLEVRHVYAKIWWDKETGMIGKRGKLARVIYMTNIGTIPDEAKINVKIGSEVIGHIDEPFLERMKKGDVFVLGGDKYQFLYARGMTIQVKAEEVRPPTIPNWVSEMLPLSFDLANEIQRFRTLMEEKFKGKKTKKEILEFIHTYLYCDGKTGNAIYQYFFEQFHYSKIPNTHLLLVEQVKENSGNQLIFHSLYGRRVNDVLSRTFGWLLSKLMHKDLAVTINDNGFILSTDKGGMQFEGMINAFKSEKNLHYVMERAIENSEILKRRFRHCATRSLMILRTYRGRTKSVGRQHMSSHLLLSAVKQLDENFSILQEAKREVLKDSMDLENAEKVQDWIKSGKLKIEILQTDVPSPFAFNLVARGRSDLIKMEGRLEFVKRMHAQVLEKIKEKGNQTTNTQ